MTSLRQIDHYLKQYACFAVLAGAACALETWFMEQPASAALKPAVRNILWLAITALPCLAAALAIWLGRELKASLLLASSMAERVATGDLSTRDAGADAGPTQEILRG